MSFETIVEYYSQPLVLPSEVQNLRANANGAERYQSLKSQRRQALSRTITETEIAVLAQHIVHLMDECPDLKVALLEAAEQNPEDSIAFNRIWKTWPKEGEAPEYMKAYAKAIFATKPMSGVTPLATMIFQVFGKEQ